MEPKWRCSRRKRRRALDGAGGRPAAAEQAGQTGEQTDARGGEQKIADLPGIHKGRNTERRKIRGKPR